MLLANTSPDWSAEYKLPKGESRKNILNLNEEELLKARTNGLLHTQVYPVSRTGMLIPYESLTAFFDNDKGALWRRFLNEIGQDLSGFHNIDQFYSWLGLSINDGSQSNPASNYFLPMPSQKSFYRDEISPLLQSKHYYAGSGLIKRFEGEGLTFSCLLCHGQNFFGKIVVGLPNKRSQANHLFKLAIQHTPKVTAPLYRFLARPKTHDLNLFLELKNNLKRVETLDPIALGLDTSLSQVALSLAKRELDAFATPSVYFEKHPRENPLSHIRADSKPMPWWNLKYKTRWLSDGSIISGNPIYTNFLWNEIGRGADLIELESWLKNNQNVINELTAAVFSTEAPRYEDFFPLDSINLDLAYRGEVIYRESCQKCHGEFVKSWSQYSLEERKLIQKKDLILNVKFYYHEKTPVYDVGTDPLRYLGMQYFYEHLNSLSISKTINTIIEPQKGYVPPPLHGIFSRYPYLHNNSIPNLCALLTHPDERPKYFYQGETIDKKIDFDDECVGFPVGKKIPKKWMKKDFLVDTKLKGLSSAGHFKMLQKEVGGKLVEKYTNEDKKALIHFLKTL